MTSTRPSSRPATRRRQRSTRLVVASGLVGVAALVVVGAAVVGSWVVSLLAGVVAVVLGAAAVRITWAEVVTSRHDAARDRAQQALGYLALTEARTSEQAIYVADTRGRMARLEATVSRLESRLVDAAAEVAETRRVVQAERDAVRAAAAVVSAERDRAVVERDRAVARLDEAEDRAAQAIVRVAELEQELDIVLAEWRAGTAAPKRKHA